MRISQLQSSDVLSGYDAVCQLYPYVPPISHWRAWEYAAYQKFNLDGRILDLGCGDGRYFNLLWPNATDVVGVDMDPAVVELGHKSGVYRKIHTTLAHQIPEQDSSFDCVFANCSLEHMNNIDLVLAEVYRCLKPGGMLLCSVVTDRFVQWTLLENLVDMAGFEDVSQTLKQNFLDFHNLANPFSVEDWIHQFATAGFSVEEHIPIVPKYNSGIFLLMDSLWHVQHAKGGEMGKVIFPFLSANARFPQGFRKVLDGLLDMEMDWFDCSGAVFLSMKPEY